MPDISFSFWLNIFLKFKQKYKKQTKSRIGKYLLQCDHNLDLHHFKLPRWYLRLRMRNRVMQSMY